MTPRQAVKEAVVRKLARVPWDHPYKDAYVEAAFTELREHAAAVSVGVKILRSLPLPSSVRRRVTTRRPASDRVVQYLDAMTPRARAQLVRDAWKEANPRWNLP